MTILYKNTVCIVLRELILSFENGSEEHYLEIIYNRLIICILDRNGGFYSLKGYDAKYVENPTLEEVEKYHKNANNAKSKIIDCQ